MKLLLISLIVTTLVHDQHRPDLDSWYGGLKRPGVSANQSYGGSSSCCSKKDCHTTEAEIRGTDWWARVGIPKEDGTWDLRDWVKVPKDAILVNHDNPTGEGVICHNFEWKPSTNVLDVERITIWCFIPPQET